jgi:hypothetical protein
MTYEQAKEAGRLLDEAMGAASARLRAIPGHASGPMGLTPDSVRATAEYKTARAESDRAFKKLQDHNWWFCKTFKAEYRAEINAHRAAKVRA